MDSYASYHLEVVRWVTIASSAIAIWEHLIHVPKEYIVWRRLIRNVRYNTRKYGRRFVTRLPLAHILMLIVRYGLLTEVGLSTTTYFGRPTTCSAVYRTMWALFCITWGACSLIFLTRVYIIYNKSTRVLAGFGLLWVAVMALWITIVTQYKASTDPSIPSPYANCLPAQDKRWRAAGWGASMFFDAIVLLATLVKLRKLGRNAAPRLDGRRSASQKMKAYILKSCLVYFCGAVLLNCTCFIVELAVPNMITSRIPSPPAFAINPVLAIRVVMSTVRSDEELAEEAAISLPGPGLSPRLGRPPSSGEKGPPPKYPLVMKQEIERSDGTSRPVSFAGPNPARASAQSLSSIKAHLKQRSDSQGEAPLAQPTPLQLRRGNPDIHLDFTPQTWYYGEQASDEPVESLEQPPFSQPASGPRTPRRGGSRQNSIEPYDEAASEGSDGSHAPRRLTFTITPQASPGGPRGQQGAEEDVVHIITPMDDPDGHEDKGTS